jgi:hypothetical protein
MRLPVYTFLIAAGLGWARNVSLASKEAPLQQNVANKTDHYKKRSRY